MVFIVVSEIIPEAEKMNVHLGPPINTAWV